MSPCRSECTSTSFTTAIASRIHSALLANRTLTSTINSKGAFYVLFIGAVAGGLALILGFLAHRYAFLLAALLAVFAFLCEAVGCVIWTGECGKIQSTLSR